MMKRLLLAPMLMLICISSWGLRWSAPTPSKYETSTIVYVSLLLNGEDFTEEGFELAAFIDGTCRADTTTLTTVGGRKVYPMRVWGSADEIAAQKPITFKAYLDVDGAPLVLKFTKTVPMTGETYRPIPLELNIDIPSWKMPATINVEQKLPASYDLSQDLEMYYDNTPDPDNTSVIDADEVTLSYVWNLEVSDEYDWEVGQDGKLKANTVGTGDVAVTIALDGTRWTSTQGSTVTVSEPLVPVTGIRVSPASIEVPNNIMEEDAMALVQVTIVPEDASDTRWAWRSTGSSEAFTATTVATPGTYQYEVYSLDNPQISTPLTIEVYQPVTSITAPQQVKVEVGTTMEELLAIVKDSLAVSPANAKYADAIEISFPKVSPFEDGDSAKKGYYATNVTIASEPNRVSDEVEAQFELYVFQPVTSISAPDTTVYIGSTMYLFYNDLYDNNKVVITPDNAISTDWDIECRGDNKPYDEFGWFNKVGEYNFTVFTTSEDFAEVSSTFKVTVIQPVERIVLTDIDEDYAECWGYRPEYTYERGQQVRSDLLAKAVVYPSDATPNDIAIEFLDYYSSSSLPSAVLDESGVAIQSGKFTVRFYSPVYPSASACYATVTILDYPQLSLVFSSLQSKYRETEATIVCPENRTYDPALVEIDFADSDLGFKDLTVTRREGNKLWVIGNTAGRSTFEISYKGEWVNGGEAFVVPELQLDNGWQWVSPYAYRTEKGMLVSGIEFTRNASNKIIDVRSQTGMLYNDDEYGLFGDITMLCPDHGMYKMKVARADNSYGLINLASADSTYTLSEDMIQKGLNYSGYNWIGYPGEYTRLFNNVKDEIAGNEGDLFIGKDGFAEYSDGSWVCSEDFKLEVNHGYIYYTESPTYRPISFPDVYDVSMSEAEFTLNGIATAANPNPVKSRVSQRAADGVFNYDASQFADNMAIVAQIPGMTNTDNWTVGAFVGDECRGKGSFVKGDKLMINVAGKAGEKVTFRLYDSLNDEFIDVPETLTYTQKAGSLSSPVKFTVSDTVTGIRGINATTAGNTYDMSGRRVENARKGLYIRDGKAVIVR